MSRIKLLAGAAFAAVIATSGVAIGASTGAFPGMPWAQAPDDARTTTSSASVDGATLQVVAVYGDPEQTAISYRIAALPKDGVGGIDGVVQLTTGDGTTLPLRWNAADPSEGAVGTLLFPPLPEGANHVVLDVGRLNFAARSVSATFRIPLDIDTTGPYAESRMTTDAVSGGSGEGAITVKSVSRTPMSVVVRGTFDGLSQEAIESMSRPQVWLVSASGERVLTDSGRFGFGENDREFELHFPNVASGVAEIQFNDLPSKADAGTTVSVFSLVVP